ncbi:B12-binding domain-containing radical SAM protein [Rubellicoccus peritrichatus]|uniref:Radical SAM protein n=1 Tax=Rubellicoccus peritrichatus TaxID=3080537 RepID=A0AAQ3LFF0_9BACT|nr:radical SAM protein [Puniceicoccus sp. CR14]WOO43717.1 radical SAM protein [Puniceicoccus sp. CR14]
MSSKPSVLFVSLSGVRIKNRRLLEAGMTLPGFVERSQVIASLPNLALLTLAAYTPEHWEVHYLDLDGINDDLIEQIVLQDYSLIAISFLTARAYDCYAFADILREQEQVVVLGGLHVSAMPDEAQLHASAIVVGEGEPVWENLLKDFQANQLKERYASSRSDIPGFSNGPIPRYDLLNIEQYNRITLQTTRGCPLSCFFCGASHTISPVRRKAISQVRRELEAILELWPKPFIELADDNTFVNKSWGKELLRLFAEYPIRWFTETDLSIGADREMLNLLAKSNCAQVLIGLESPSSSTLGGMDPGKWKARTQNKATDYIKRIQDHGISVNGCFILGSDEDGPECFERTAETIDALELAEAQITLLTAFPGTQLYSRLKSENRLISDHFWDACTLFDVTFEPLQMTRFELEEGFYQLMQEVYNSERVRNRKAHFNACTKIRRKSRNATVSSL